jgi:translation initiation factor IF-1
MTAGEKIPDAPEPPRGLRATVLARCANGMFRLQTTDGRELMAHVAQDLRMAFSRLLPGDQVIAEPSPFDPTKARICRLLPTTQRSSHSVLPTRQPQQRELS